MDTFDSRRIVQDLLPALPGLVAYVDRNLDHRHVSQEYAEWFGISHDQCLRSNMRDLIGEQGMAKERVYLERAFAGTAQIFERFTPHQTGTRMVRVRYLPAKDLTGEVFGLFVFVEDITAKPQPKPVTKLTESQNYLRLILDSSQHGLWGLNTSGEVTFINRRAVTLLGYQNEDELLGKQMHALVHYQFEDGRPHPKTDCPMYDSFRNRKTHHVMNDVLWRKNGTCFPVSYYSTPVIWDNECVGSVVSFEDMSVQKALEISLDLERLKSLRNSKLALLGEISAGIAHEINNPLAIIAGTVDLLTSLRKEDDKFDEKIQILKRSCHRIARIVNGLQKYARSGPKAQLRKYGIVKLIQEALVLTEGKSKRHLVPVNFEGTSEAEILCDEVEIQQVVINLINNAIDAAKALPEKWVHVSVSEDGPSIVLRVTDSGPGIPEPIRQRIFEPFFTTKDVGKGTGLGLSVTKGILDEHDASIGVEADQSHTCFEIRFPKA